MGVAFSIIDAYKSPSIPVDAHPSHFLRRLQLLLDNTKEACNMTRLILLVSSTLLANIALLSNARNLIWPPNGTTHQVGTLESTNLTDVRNNTHTKNKRAACAAQSVWCTDEMWADDDWGGFHKNVWLAHPWKRNPLCWECYTRGVSDATNHTHDYTLGCTISKYTLQACGPMYKFKDPVLPPPSPPPNAVPQFPKIDLHFHRHGTSGPTNDDNDNEDDDNNEWVAATDPNSVETMDATGRLTRRDGTWAGIITDQVELPAFRHWKNMRRVTFQHPFIPGLEVCGVAHWRNETTQREEWITIRDVSNNHGQCDLAVDTIDIDRPRPTKPRRGYFRGTPKIETKGGLMVRS
ncbi:hypothetical protein P3342_008766 [Pyrenophora teres f. teres]|nr:hypothetical protein HRS9139_07484 [Pyrenophora teres f. teres]KAE8829314.1 hypothetical protein HRS9122_09129 [Pyrenophora teres f. teres]KAE8830865.1 hypothetical protein PTNB85_07452 [Pyrenophora teres f. teres]KAE8857137.1 hypothetical protein PTNB29_08204 [Pyrenophora teres f. teres]KAK1910885.1 hypothetical protein P3342_008766 [Pyrenophora teres f. teres]